MTVSLESGNSLTNLKYARVLHAGNRFRLKAITASSTATGSDATAPDDPETFEYWTAFDNSVPVPLDFSDSAWTATNVTVASDGQTVTDDATNAVHSLSDTATTTAVEWVFGVEVERQTLAEFQLYLNDGTTTFTCFFDMRDGTVGTASNCTGQIQDLGDNRFYCSIYMTVAAASSTFEFRGSDGAEATTYIGASDTIKLLRMDLNPSAATWDADLFTATSGNCICLAGHNLGTRNGRIRIYYGSSPTLIDTLSPTDDSPIMFLFDAQSSADWRVAIDRAAGPKVAVIRIGSVLTMERPFYGGFSPAHWNRTDQLTGNKSEGGQFLGRDIINRGFAARYDWQNLTDAWIRTNLDGMNGLIRAVRKEPFFIAWRALEQNDCDYAWTAGPVAGPVFSGTRDLASFSIEAEGHGYE